jgi:hypothetical protein
MSELAIAAVFLTLSLIWRRLQGTLLTASMFFVAVGVLLGSNLIKLVNLGQVAPFFLVVGVVALALSLFNQNGQTRGPQRGAGIGEGVWHPAGRAGRATHAGWAGRLDCVGRTLFPRHCRG